MDEKSNHLLPEEEFWLIDKFLDFEWLDLCINVVLNLTSFVYNIYKILTINISNSKHQIF